MKSKISKENHNNSRNYAQVVRISCEECKIEAQQQTHQIQQKHNFEQNHAYLFLYTKCGHFICFSCTLNKFADNYRMKGSQTSIMCCNQKTTLQQKTIRLIKSKLINGNQKYNNIEWNRHEPYLEQQSKQRLGKSNKNEIQIQATLLVESQSLADQRKNTRPFTNIVSKQLQNQNPFRLYGIVRRRHNINQNFYLKQSYKQPLSRKVRQNSNQFSDSCSRSRSRYSLVQSKYITLNFSQSEKHLNKQKENARENITNLDKDYSQMKVRQSIIQNKRSSNSSKHHKRMNFSIQNSRNVSDTETIQNQHRLNYDNIVESKFSGDSFNKQDVMKSTLMNGLNFTSLKQTNSLVKDLKEMDVKKQKAGCYNNSRINIKQSHNQSSINDLQFLRKPKPYQNQMTNSISDRSNILSKSNKLTFNLGQHTTEKYKSRNQQFFNDTRPLVSFSKDRHDKEQYFQSEGSYRVMQKNNQEIQKSNKIQTRQNNIKSKKFEAILSIQIERVRGQFNFLHEKLRLDQQQIVNCLFQIYARELSFQKYGDSQLNNAQIPALSTGNLEIMAHKMVKFIDGCKIPLKLDVRDFTSRNQINKDTCSTWVSKKNNENINNQNDKEHVQYSASYLKNQVSYSRSTGNLLQKLDINQQRMKQAFSKHYTNLI